LWRFLIEHSLSRSPIPPLPFGAMLSFAVVGSFPFILAAHNDDEQTLMQLSVRRSQVVDQLDVLSSKLPERVVDEMGIPRVHESILLMLGAKVSGDVDNAWITNKHADLVKQAAAVNNAIVACKSTLDPFLDAVKLARQNHATCRTEQLAVLAGNVDQKCKDDKEKDCKTMQSSFETDYCSWEVAHKDQCSAALTCVIQAEANRQTTVTNLQLQVTYLKEAYVVYKQQECVTQKWEMTATERTECRSLAPSTVHLDVAFPPAPPRPVCQTDPYNPGDAEWETQEYGNQPWSNLTSAVTSCAGPPMTCASGAYTCPNQCGSGAGGRFRSWCDAKGTCTDDYKCILRVEEFTGWSLTVPQGAKRFTFKAMWGWWDGNGCGDGTATVSVPNCQSETITRAAATTPVEFDCNVAGLSTVAINKPHTTSCEYIFIAEPQFDV